MTHAALILSLVLCAAPLRAEVGVAEVWNELFSDARDQRILYAITADPETDKRFGAGLKQVLDKQADPDQFERAKRQFQVTWLGEINSFSQKYSNGDAGLAARMPQISKPDLGTMIKSEKAKAAAGNGSNLGWFLKYDEEKWKGKLLPALWEKSTDPYLLEYSIASMRAMDAEQQKILFEKLKPAESWLSVGSTAEEMFKASRKELVADLGKAQGSYASRAKTAKEQLAAIEGKLREAGTLVASGKIEDAASAGAKFDGSKDLRGSPDSSVVDARPSKDVPPVAGGSLTANTESVAADSPGGFSIRDVPPPKTDKAYGAASAKSTMGSKIGAVLKSPKVMGGIGALFGGIIGFLLGGPLGALAGLAGGALLLGGATHMLNK